MLDDGKQPYCHVQSFTPRVLQLDQGCNWVDNVQDPGDRRKLDRQGSPGFRDYDHVAHLVVAGEMPLRDVLSDPISNASLTCLM
jgi:hypothetical protein